jgi:hypothetical protein
MISLLEIFAIKYYGIIRNMLKVKYMKTVPMTIQIDILEKLMKL